MRLSLVIGIFMLCTKVLAYYLTGSAAVLSDASESVVHVFAVSFAAYSLRLSWKPPDQSHHYGHDKIAFFSAGLEGLLIILAAAYVISVSVHKWIAGAKPDNLGKGAALILAAGVINAVLGGYLLKAGRKYHSLILEADGRHVLTDCWTSLGVIAGLGLTHLTGWADWDPLVAILIALNIVWAGQKLIRRSIGGLMDEADPATESQLTRLLVQITSEVQISFHALRCRNAGNTVWIEFHLLFHKGIALESAHAVATRIEEKIQQAMGSRVEIISHLEILEDHDLTHTHPHPKEFVP